MKRILFSGLLVLAASSVQARDKNVGYQSGLLLQMNSASCGTAEKGSKTVAGEFLGTDGEHKKTQELLCQEYVLQSDRLIFRIRPKDDKHPALLPVGESAQFRLHKDKMLLRVPEAGGKEREYIVVSMNPRADNANSSSQITERLPH